MKWLKPLLLVAALGHIMIGLYFLYAVEVAARLVGFDLLTTGSRGLLRGLAGGLVVALGAMILRGAVGGRFGRQWLYAAGLIYTGFLAGRVVSVGMDGLAAHTVFVGLFEAALAVLFFWSGAEMGRPAVTAADAPEPGGSGEPMVTPPSRPPSPQSGSLTGSSTPAQDDATPEQDDRTSNGSPGSVGGGE